ncbi:MAG TPA: TIGR00730 family Rossman fold protein [Candidatus Babeliales bacterium]|nr:TIGR00730 family Rossman fold protein [Candidatus Babeliales bacterium]
MFAGLKRFLYTYGVLLKGSLRTTFQLIYGVWKISKLPQPIVTVFGGSRLEQDTIYARQAHLLAHKLVELGISVITGGGPGIMQAATCGARAEIPDSSRARTLGVLVSGLSDSEPLNECVMDDYVVTDYFFARKYLLINYSVAFAVFPGGFGTLEELTEILTLMETKKLSVAPVVLIGTEYWKPFLCWLKDYSLRENLIRQEQLNYIRVTDDLDEAVKLLQHACQECADLLKKK